MCDGDLLIVRVLLCDHSLDPRHVLYSTDKKNKSINVSHSDLPGRLPPLTMGRLWCTPAKEQRHLSGGG